MKLQWEHVSESFYDINFGNKHIGTMQRGSNHNWIVDIPELKIHRENQYRQDLMKYVEKAMEDETKWKVL